MAIDRVGYNDTEYAKLIFDPDDSYRVIGPDEGNRSTVNYYGDGLTLKNGDVANVVGGK